MTLYDVGKLTRTAIKIPPALGQVQGSCLNLRREMRNAKLKVPAAKRFAQMRNPISAVICHPKLSDASAKPSRCTFRKFCSSLGSKRT